DRLGLGIGSCLAPVPRCGVEAVDFEHWLSRCEHNGLLIGACISPVSAAAYDLAHAEISNRSFSAACRPAVPRVLRRNSRKKALPAPLLRGARIQPALGQLVDLSAR